MLDLSNHVWFPHMHRAIVQMAQNCKHCTEEVKNLKPIIGKKHSFQMEPVVEPNEEVQLDFAGPLPDELNKEAYILVAIDKWSKFPTAKVVTNTTADIAIKFMQRYISNNGVPRRIRCDQAQTFRARNFQLFCHTNNIKLLFAPVDDHRAIGVVERMIQTLKRRLAVMRIDKTNIAYKLASDVAEIIKTLRITPHSVTKISPFEAHMGRTPNTTLSNLGTNSSPENLNMKNAKLACLDRKNLTKPPLPAEVLHDLQRWSEGEGSINKRDQKPQMPLELTNSDVTTQQKDTGVKSKAIEKVKNKLNIRYKGLQTTVDKNTKKRIDQVARKTIRIATKVKDPRTFEQKYKTIDGKILTYTTHHAWVQTFGKLPRLLRNSGVAFVTNPLIYGPCRQSRLSDYVAYKSARRSGPCLRFLDIENPTAPQHPMFREDKKTGLPKKLTQKERKPVQGKSDSPAKRKTKATGKRTDGRPTRKLQTSGMSLQVEIPGGNSQANETATPSFDKHEEDDQSSDSSEDIDPSPKRQNKKQTHPTNAPEPLRKATRNGKSALSHAFGNPVPINAIEDKKNEETKQPSRFQIDSPPDRQENAYPSLKSLIQEIALLKKLPNSKHASNS